MASTVYQYFNIFINTAYHYISPQELFIKARTGPQIRISLYFCQQTFTLILQQYMLHMNTGMTIGTLEY